MKTPQSIVFLFLVLSFVLKANASEITGSASLVVARILDRKITADDIGLKYDTNKMPIFPKEADSLCVLNDTIDKLCSLVISEVEKDYITRNKLKATDDEIREFNNHLGQFIAQDRRRRQRQLVELEVQLKDTKLTPKEREQSEKRRSTLINLARHEKRTDEMSPLTIEELRDIDGPWVEAWKFNKSVYEKYHGVVEMTKFGPVPVEARARLLAQYEKDGRLLILDETLKSKFWGDLAKPPRLLAKPQEIDFTPSWKKPMPKDEKVDNQ